MVVVLKIEGLRKLTNEGEIRKFFSNSNARPEDIHLYSSPTWETAMAFLAYTNSMHADNGLKLDGAIFKREQISVIRSDETEFKDFLPDTPLITNFQQRDTSFSGVVKVEGLSSNTTLSEIRGHFKERDARPENIHLPPKDGRNPGIAFVIFTGRGTFEKALRIDGSVLRDNVIAVRESNAAEFKYCCPNASLMPPKSASIDTQLLNTSYSGKLYIKIDGLPSSVKLREIRKFFCDHNARPDDIQLVLGKNQQQVGAALMIYTNPSLFEAARKVDGSIFQGHKITVLVSNEKEFLFYFPDPSRRDGFPREHERRHSSRDRGRSGSERRDRRDRSRSPHRDIRPAISMSPANTFAAPIQREDPSLPGVDQALFLTMIGLPTDISVTQIVNFFHPITVHDAYIMRRYNGKECRVVVEFFTRKLANEAFNSKKNQYLSSSPVDLFYANVSDIAHALNMPMKPEKDVPQGNHGGGDNNVQNLLGLLTATVSAMASNQQQPQHPHTQSSSLHTTPFAEIKNESRDRERGCVVGIRNLPYSVTTEEILRFFHGFYPVSDSVKIHRLSDGRCSGEAVISFRSNADAVHATNSLHGRSLGQKRLDLFNLRTV